MTAEPSPSPSRARTGKPSVLLRAALGLFVVGLCFVVAVFLLFALGNSDLPVWLSVAAIGFTSAGFGLGLVALLREARSR